MTTHPITPEQYTNPTELPSPAWYFIPKGRAVVIVLWRFVRRSWSAITQPGTGGLVQPGDWRCRYKDGKCTYWMSYGDAANMRSVFGGRLEWRGDFPPNNANEPATGS